MLPQQICGKFLKIRCSEIVSEAIKFLERMQSRCSYMVHRVLHPINFQLSIYAFEKVRTTIGRTASGMTDSEIACREYWKKMSEKTFLRSSNNYRISNWVIFYVNLEIFRL